MTFDKNCQPNDTCLCVNQKVKTSFIHYSCYSFIRGGGKMDNDQRLIVASAAFIIIAGLLIKRKRKHQMMMPSRRTRSTRPIRSFLKDIVEDEETGDSGNFTIMSYADFSFLSESIRKDNELTKFRKAVTAELRLAITLRYLTTGDSYNNLQKIFRVSKQIITIIIPEVCKALVRSLSENVKVPSTVEDWREISKKFEDTWSFPHCLGALDEKHILMQSRFQSDINYYDYKSSIVLMALVDADYNFIYVNIGRQKGVSDGGLFKKCQLFKQLEEQKLNFPEPSNLPGRSEKVPFVFIADEAFALSDHIMKPYSGVYQKGSKEMIYNDRHSRARAVTENAFGMISSAFRILRKPILLEPEKAQLIVMAIVSLHNFLKNRITSKNIYAPEGSFYKEVIPVSSKSEIDGITTLTPSRNISQKSSDSPNSVRAEFAEYFSSIESVPCKSDS